MNFNTKALKLTVKSDFFDDKTFESEFLSQSSKTKCTVNLVSR